MYLGIIETWSLKILHKSFHENYSDLFKKITRYLTVVSQISRNYFTSISQLSCNYFAISEGTR